jgi:hypothetical protein
MYGELVSVKPGNLCPITDGVDGPSGIVVPNGAVKHLNTVTINVALPGQKFID